MNFRNVFLEFGYNKEEIDARLEETFQNMFYGPEGEKIYYEVGDDMGYFTDTGNNDVRTEGQSYGMMMCVQLNKKEEFDRIWKWTKTYMYLSEGVNAGYFCWSNQTDGKKNSQGPAPDGEEFFAAALILASRRWGDGEGIFNYSNEAVAIMKAMLHNPVPMYDYETKYIKFVAGCNYSDPSYHLPHFYELYADELKKKAAECKDTAETDELIKDAGFYEEAAVESRKYFEKSCHPETGMSAEYAQYDGTPFEGEWTQWGRHDYFYSDAYRTAANMGLDYSWCIVKNIECAAVEKERTAALRKFFEKEVKFDSEGPHFGVYEIDGKPVAKEDDSETASSGVALHPYGLLATLAMSYLATAPEDGDKAEGSWAVRKFWELPLRKGRRRYYDNCLYLFAFMALSGNYRFY